MVKVLAAVAFTVYVYQMVLKRMVEKGYDSAASAAVVFFLRWWGGGLASVKRELSGIYND